jgi:endonuclease/exonuclease/phosphatase family metal-dependent hydrolase
LSGCATARNYTSAEGPGYETLHGAIPSPKASLRVVTFNLQFGREIDRAIEVLRGTERLRSADIIALQEMDAAGVERIARILSLNSVYFPSAIHPKTGRDFGTALLSPWPLEAPRKLLLPHASRLNHLRRAATAVTVRVRDQRIRTYSVHLETVFGLSGAARREQLQTILADARDFHGPAVIAGDLNGRGIATLAEKEGFLWLTRDVQNTIAWLEFDHILARDLVPASPTPAGVAESRGASDHKPVWSEVTLRRESAHQTDKAQTRVDFEP